MDIFSHGLWAGAAGKAVNKKTTGPLNFWRMVWWGIFPDLLGFTPVFVWLFWNLIFNGLNLADLPGPEKIEPWPGDTLPIFRLTSTLYAIGHSAIIFLVVFGIVFLVFKKPVWEMGGWLFHILLDIPTHSYKFYATPFLWPLSNFKFDGFPWTSLWFLIPNYLFIILVYFLLRRRKKNTG